MIKVQKKRFTVSQNQIDWKISDTTNIKECYQSYLKKKNDKTIKKNCSKTKNYRKFKIVHIKIATIEHPKTSQKLSKTIKETKKPSHVGSGKNSHSHLYSEKRGMKKRKNNQETN